MKKLQNGRLFVHLTFLYVVSRSWRDTEHEYWIDSFHDELS